MRYAEVREATFLRRLNRFVAEVALDGRVEQVHVKNTGRCAELLVTGYRVYLERSGNPARRTAYDLIGVDKPVAGGTRYINMGADRGRPGALPHTLFVAENLLTRFHHSPSLIVMVLIIFCGSPQSTLLDFFALQIQCAACRLSQSCAACAGES